MKNGCFEKQFFIQTIVFIKLVVSLTIVNDDLSLTIANIIFFFKNYRFFQKRSFFKNNCIKTVANRFYKKRSFSKTIVIPFLKVQNEWVVFKNDSFFPKTKRSFLKTIEKRNKDD